MTDTEQRLPGCTCHAELGDSWCRLHCHHGKAKLWTDGARRVCVDCSVEEQRATIEKHRAEGAAAERARIVADMRHEAALAFGMGDTAAGDTLTQYATQLESEGALR